MDIASFKRTLTDAAISQLGPIRERTESLLQVLYPHYFYPALSLYRFLLRRRFHHFSQRPPNYLSYIYPPLDHAEL